MFPNPEQCSDLRAEFQCARSSSKMLLDLPRELRNRIYRFSYQSPDDECCIGPDVYMRWQMGEAKHSAAPPEDGGDEASSEDEEEEDEEEDEEDEEEDDDDESMGGYIQDGEGDEETEGNEGDEEDIMVREGEDETEGASDFGRFQPEEYLEDSHDEDEEVGKRDKMRTAQVLGRRRMVARMSVNLGLLDALQVRLPLESQLSQTSSSRGLRGLALQINLPDRHMSNFFSSTTTSPPNREMQHCKFRT